MERLEVGIKRDDVDVLINVCFICYLMDYVVCLGDVVVVDVGVMSLCECVIVIGGMVFFVFIFGFFLIFDICK